jgi:hypothetical protein
LLLLDGKITKIKKKIKRTVQRPARNAMDAHAQDLVPNDELLPPTVKALAQCTGSL